MANASRQTILPTAGSSLRQSTHPGSSFQQSSALSARIASKRFELENLKQLRDVSAALASQMEALEEKLETLKDGTEAVACVMANWGNVLSAIKMASTKTAQTAAGDATTQRPGDGDDDLKHPLPATLVRIPAEQTSGRRRSEDADETQPA